MNETIDLMLEGCKMARFLEGNLLNMANQPEHLISSCDEIIRVFSKAKENISKAQVGVLPEPHLAAGVQEWLRNSQTQAMDLLRSQQLLGARSSNAQQQLPADAKLKEIDHGGGLEEMVVGQMGGGGGGPPRALESTREIESTAIEAAASGGGRASSWQRQRRRGGGDRRIEIVAAPRMGNTGIPPEDGYTWRKYGQKDILHSRFPRSYFRCTHQRLYQCPAKKLVQRLDNDPNRFEVTYRGDHTCHLSSTAPSVPPPPSLELMQGHTMTQQPSAGAVHPLPMTSTTTVSMSQWLSMDISVNRDFGVGHAVAGGGVVGSTSSNNMNLASGSTGAAAGPSTSRYGREVNVDYQPVTDLADAMFNSGSSSNNSMELIFSSIDRDKLQDSGDKKN